MAEPSLGAISRVVIQNFKSISACDVELTSLTLLVGPNGSGKSNFLDALKLTRDALRTNLENAVRERGGIDDVRRRSTGHPNHFGIRVDLELPNGRAEYAFRIAMRGGFTFEVQRETCRVFRTGEPRVSYTFENGELTTEGPELRSFRLTGSTLALPTVSGLTEYRPVFDTLSSLGFYSFNPDRARDLQNSDVGDYLSEDGSNLASVIRRMRIESPSALKRATDFLSTVVPGIRDVGVREFGSKESVEFKQEVVGATRPWTFLASNVSDGTIRALCVLVAAFQDATPLAAIEEPEAAIHPGAAARLMDALLEASKRHQVILTTHSPDLLDHPDIEVDSVLAVQSQRGTTTIGRIDEAARKAVHDNLYSVGELLRLEQVQPDMFSSSGASVRLF